MVDSDQGCQRESTRYQCRQQPQSYWYSDVTARSDDVTGRIDDVAGLGSDDVTWSDDIRAGGTDDVTTTAV